MNRTARLCVKVAPGSSEDRVTGWLGETLKLRVRAQPEKGKANAAVVVLLATALGVPSEDISVVAGLASRTKVVEIHGMSAHEIRRKLNRQIA